ncbi:MAG: Gfo/Idh/MocA family oxidoreductase [Steroidobacteraceae bacterium]
MRYGLVGLGGIGAVRLAALRLAPRAQLTAAFDVNKAALAALPDGVRKFDSAESMAQSDVCDAVIISTPTQHHAPVARMCLQHGKHVLVEKPMASSLEECAAMIGAAREAKRVLTVGFNHRYFDAVKVVREAIACGDIGELRYVKGFAGHTGLSEFKAPWMYDKKIMGGGTLLDNGIHVMDLVCHLMGSRVSAAAGMTDNRTWKLAEVEDNAFVHLRSASGVLGSVHSSWTEWKGYHFFVEVYGERGMARAYYAPMHSLVVTLDKPGGQRTVSRRFFPTAILREKIRGWQSTVIRTFLEEFADFERLVAGEPARIIATAEDGYRGCEIPAAVYRSNQTGQFVELTGCP